MPQSNQAAVRRVQRGLDALPQVPTRTFYLEPDNLTVCGEEKPLRERPRYQRKRAAVAEKWEAILEQI